MNRDTLRQSLRQPYNRENWTGLVRSVFGEHVRLNTEAQALPTEDESIKSIAQIGDVTLDDGRNLAVIEVEVADNINLLRNRVNLRNRVAKFIDQDKAHGVLAVFSSNHPEYRFSFTAKETIFDESVGMVEKETATKRFTYVLGPGETCTTAADRFEKLSQKTDSLSLDDVVDAFSVEKLNKEFFNNYREHYEHFCNYLLSDAKRKATHKLFDIPKGSTDLEQSRLEKPIRDFVKRLLGRIVFLHFLQKKGWMGCSADTAEWIDGDHDFLRNFYKETEDKSQFHSQQLVPLFFEALNKPDRPNDVFALTGTRIPYLNGGLFESLIKDETAIDFPASYFEDLLDFFAQYNFTIDENDPDEHEVGIDPEMLGHIFENLLEDNKDKGAYYTPKAIVHYMCQQSILYYLLTHLEDNETSRPAIEYLVRTKQIGEGTAHGDYIRKNAARIEQLLDDVKVCDPAIGSGAFPIGLLQEIFWLKLTLDLTLNEPSQLADVKRAIIQNSIYGVDKDAGAVSIARLRFWLALVVDEDRPRPLPNLDYKIMQGDSLLESFEGVPLNSFDADNLGGVTIDPKAQVEMDFASGQMQLTAEEKANRITDLTKDYFVEANPETKQSIHKEIDQFVLNHIDYNLSIAQEAFEIELHQHRAEIRKKQDQLASFTPKPKTAKRIAWLEKSIAEIALKKTKLEALEHEAERPYFLWHLFFQDVFAQGGFDIVIANPPYVRQEIIKDYKPLLQDEGYECFKGTADLFVYFYERSVNLLNDRGVLTYITSNKYYQAGYGEKLCGFLADKLRIFEMLDFGDAPVFDAIAYASILIGAKEPVADDHALKAWTWQRGQHVSRIASVMESDAFPILQENLKLDGWRIERPEVFALLEKLYKGGIPLDDYVDGRFYYGIKTGLNEAFVVDEKTKEQLIVEHPSSAEVLKPYLRGKDLNRWKSKSEDLWLIYIPWHFPLHINNKKGGVDKEAEQRFLEEFPAIYKHLLKFESQLKARNKAETGIRYEWYALQRWGADYWEEWETPKIILGRFMNKPLYAFDDLNYYHNNALSFIAGATRFLVSILNSSTCWWFLSTTCTDLQNGYIQAHNANQKVIPIPSATDKDKQLLEDLANSAAQAEGPALAAIEAEINQIVYHLFDLTSEEIRLIESSISQSVQPTIQGEHGKTTQKEGLFRRVKELSQATPYISFAQIKQAVRADKIAEKDDTLKEYISEAVKSGLIHNAGKGWYTRLKESAKLEVDASNPLPRMLKERFPLLPFYHWSTKQVNPWMHHLLGKFVDFVFVDAEGAEDLAEYIRDHTEWNVILNPTAKSGAESNIREMTVVVRSIRREFDPEIEPSVETLLVDLFTENNRLQLMDLAEFQQMALNLITSTAIDIARLQRLLGDRKKHLTDLLGRKATHHLGSL